MDNYIQISAKTVDDAITEALLKLETTSDMIEYEVIEKGSSGLFGFIGSKPAVIKARKKYNLMDKTRVFLDELFDAMKIPVESAITYDEDNRQMDITFNGDEMGMLIGKRGQTLDSLQYIISLVVNKEKDTDAYIRVKVDTENYRERRKETLETLAKNIAYKVKRNRRPVALEPMNPYERRIIHSALQNDRFVETHSEGVEPYRKVVITLKKVNKDNREHKDFKDRKDYKEHREKVNR